LYAIGDLHLHFQSELKAPGQRVGVWKDHEAIDRHNVSKHFTTIVPKLNEIAEEKAINLYREVKYN